MFGRIQGDGGVTILMEKVLNQVLQAQVSEQFQASPYERTADRQGHRNGTRARKLTTRVGTLMLRVPQIREDQFSTDLLCQCRMPDTLRKHLWNKWQDLASKTIAQVVDGMLPAFRPQTPNEPVRISGLALTRVNYVAHFLEALRHSTHGFDSRHTDKTILFTHTGEISDDLPYLAFFWWVGILAKPEWLFV